MHHNKKPLLKVVLLGIDICLVVLILFVAKNLIVVNSEAKTSPISEDQSDPIAEVSLLPKLETITKTLIQPQKSKQEIKVSPKVATLLSLINESRIQENLGPLAYNQNLSNLANSYSEDMSKKNFFSHTSPDGKTPSSRLELANINFETAGENIAYAPTIQSAHINLMNSKEHRDNILNPDFTKVGLGIFEESTSKIFITEIFTN